MSQYFKIGKLAASHGLQGDLVLQHSLGKKTSLKGLETIYVELSKDNLLPYFIQKCRLVVARKISVLKIRTEAVQQRDIQIVRRILLKKGNDALKLRHWGVAIRTSKALDDASGDKVFAQRQSVWRVGMKETCQT